MSPGGMRSIALVFTYRRSVCSKHGSNPCETHIRHEAKIVAEFTDGTIQTPQHIFVTPSREVVERIFDIPGEGEFLVALQKAIRKVAFVWD